MASITDRYDDVMLTLRNKKVLATHRVRFSIPGPLRPNGRSESIVLDVSDEGERELNKQIEQMQKDAIALGDKIARFKNASVEKGRQAKLETVTLKTRTSGGDDSSNDGKSDATEGDQESPAHADSETAATPDAEGPSFG